MRLIDAEALENKINVKRRGKVLFEVGYNMAIDKSVEAIENAPTIETKPVVHAHWESDFDFDPEEEQEIYFYFCSKCKNELFGNKEDFKYCPYCGAQMDEVTE